MNVLLISEDKLKTYTALNDNVFGKVICPVIKTSQDIYLQQILGTALMEKLQTLVKENQIGSQENTKYKKLLDEYVAPYLIYETLVNLVPEVGTKIANIGVVQNNDEHTMNVSQGERELVSRQYQTYADNYCKQMQAYLCQNSELYPELKETQLVEPHLNSAATTSLWLGGIRHKNSHTNKKTNLVRYE